jgi:hypothetical protein
MGSQWEDPGTGWRYGLALVGPREDVEIWAGFGRTTGRSQDGTNWKFETCSMYNRLLHVRRHGNRPTSTSTVSGIDFRQRQYLSVLHSVCIATAAPAPSYPMGAGGFPPGCEFDH